MTAEVDAYLARIGFVGTPTANLETLKALQLAHLMTVPFTNVDVFARRPVAVDAVKSHQTVVEDRRGGWCFVLNGAFARLLEAIGFTVDRLGAAVVMFGPNRIVDHLTLAVMLDEPWLVDVGFGRRGPMAPIPLGRREPFGIGSRTFELLNSSEGTTLTEVVAEVPEPLYRFRRVALTMEELVPASDRLQSDRSLFWSQAPFATRLVDDGGTRVTLSHDRLTTIGPTIDDERAVGAANWNDVLFEHFGLVEAFTPGQLAG